MLNGARHSSRMSLLDHALRLLRRPVDQAGEPAPQPQGTNDDAAPLTEAELNAALQQLADDREAAYAVLSGAADRRESLLMTPGTDDEIIGLEGEISRANLTLERLDRLEPDLKRRLGEVIYYNRGAKWIVDRDVAAAEFAKFVQAEDAYRKAREEWATVWNGLQAKWSTANEIMPFMAKLVGRKTSFAEQLEDFRTRVIVLREPERAPVHSLAQAIDFTKQFGHPPEGVPPDWIAECQRAASGSATVRTLVATLDGEGRSVPKGTVIEMDYAGAEKAVHSGRAIFEEK